MSRGRFCGRDRCARSLRGGVVQRRDTGYLSRCMACHCFSPMTKFTLSNQDCSAAVTCSSGKLLGFFDGHGQEEGHIAAELCCEGLPRFCCWHSPRLAGSTCHPPQATKRSLTALHRLFEDMTSAFEARRGGGLPSVLLSTRYLFVRDPGNGLSSHKGVRCSCPMWVIARQLLSCEVEGVRGRRRSLETVSQTSQQNELLLSPAALPYCPCSGPHGVHAAGDVADDQHVAQSWRPSCALTRVFGRARHECDSVSLDT